MKTENSQKYHVFLVALILIISVSFIYMYYSFIISPTGLSAFNETDNGTATSFPPVWSFNSTVFRINKNSELILDLNQYFSDPDNDSLNYLATQPSSFTVLLEGAVLNARPNQNFFGERTITITVSDETHIVNQDISVIVEETSASFNEGASIQDKDNKFVGKKVVDETEFETYFNYIIKNETGLFLSFYHDSPAPQRIWIEGDVIYELRQNVSLANENVTLVVFRHSGVVPKFKLHIGETSEVFEFGKEIPDVIIESEGEVSANFSFIDRDDELLDVEVTQESAHAVIKGINVSEVEVKMGQSAEGILNTEVFAAEPIAIETAEIVLPKNGDVTAIMECADFDLSSFSCNSSWVNSGLSFVENDTHVFFTVDHFSGYGGADIDVITVQSYPMVGGIWTVAFNVTGTANLTITAENGTAFGTDLVFLSLSCGDAVVLASYDGTSVFYENFNCSYLAYETSTVLSRGKHTLKFLFGNEEDYAFNEAYSGAYNLSTANFSVYGENPSDHAGYSMATADFNGDNVNDLLIGAPDYNQGGRADVGKAYVVLGPFPTDGSALNLSSANASWIGANASDHAGFAVAAGDVNADGYDDVVIGAPYYDKDGQPANVEVGMVYLFYGSAKISGNYNLSNVSGANGFNASFQGQNSSDHAGWSLAVGNLSGDAREDIVIGAPDWHANTTLPGRVYVIFGTTGFLSGSNVSLSDTDNASFIGQGDADQFGLDVAIGDVTGDGKGDLLVGAPRYDQSTDSGKIYIVNGSLSNDMGIAGIVAGYANGSYYGEGPTSHFGYSVDAGGDVNNDTITDFIVGAYLDDNTITNRGAAYLVYGRTAYSADSNISIAANASWRGQAGNDELGYSVLLGNLLNDSYADVFISSYNQSSVGGNLAGRFYIIYGQNVTENLGQNISAAADASWYTQFQGSGGPMASGSLWIGSWAEGYDSVPLDPTDSPVSEPGRGYMVSGVNPVHPLVVSGPGPGGGGGGGPGPSPSPGICVKEPIKFTTSPPIYAGDTVDVTITTSVTSGIFSVPSFGLAIKLNPWEATINGNTYTWNFPMEVPSIAAAGEHQAFFTNSDGTSCGNPLIFEVEPQLCSLPPIALTPVTGEDTPYDLNFVTSFLDTEDDLFQVIGSTRMVPRGNSVARDIVNIPSKVTVEYCDGTQAVTANVPLTMYDSYFGDLVSIDFMIGKYMTEAGLVSGVISSDAIAPAAVAGITGAGAYSGNKITGRALTEFSGFTEHVTDFCVSKNPAGELSIVTASCAPKECPSGQVQHWCDCACVPEEFNARDTARLREIMEEAQAMLPSAPSGAPVAVGDVVNVPQVFGGGTGSTLFDGKRNLPDAAFDHPVNVKVEYPDGSVLGVDHPDADEMMDEMRRSMEFMEQEKAVGETGGPAASRPGGGGGGGGGIAGGGMGGDPRKPPPQAEINPRAMPELQRQMEGLQKVSLGAVANTPVVISKQVSGRSSGLKSITGVVGSGTSVGYAYPSSSKGMSSITGMQSAGGDAGAPPGVSSGPGSSGGTKTGTGWTPVNKGGHENPSNTPPPCTPPTIPNPQPSPGTTVTPVITHGASGTTVTISIAPPGTLVSPEGITISTAPPGTLIPSEGIAIGSIATATAQGIRLMFPVPPEIALRQRFGGEVNIWTGTSYENAWVGMGTNINDFGPGVFGPGGGVSAPSQPSTPSPQPEPEPETPGPSEGEPAPAPTSGPSVEGEGGRAMPTDIPVGGEPGGAYGGPGSVPTEPISTPAVSSPSTSGPAPAPISGPSSTGEGGRATPTGTFSINTAYLFSFWHWLLGLFS